MLRRLWAQVAQVSAVIALGLMLGFGAAAALTLAKFSEALSDAIEARYAIHAADLRGNIETGLNLGLDLAEMGDNVALVVRNRLMLDEGIAQILVTAADGTGVFAMDRPAAGLDPTPPDARLHRRSLGLENSFGETVGTVTVVFASEVNEATLRGAATLLLRDLGALVALSVGLATLGCLVALAPLPAALRRAEATLSLADAPAGADPDAPPATEGGLDGHTEDDLPDDDLEAEATAAARAGRRALVDLAQIEAALAADLARRGA